MTRVIGGEAGGRRLDVPAGRDTRPTSDRAREGLFGSVGSVLGTLRGIRVLDLYAGSGAVGLEAASRGAGHVLLVESGAGALRTIQRNVRHLGLSEVEVAADRVSRLVARGPGGSPYDLVFADPPYSTSDEAVTTLLEELRGRGWLAPAALVVVERSSHGGPLPWPPGFVADRVRRYGDATLWYGLAGRGE